MPLSSFHPIIAEWFSRRLGTPTDVQAQSWPAIRSGSDVLISAPTGSGKTLAAFLSCIDALLKQALACELSDKTQVVYISPLKALSNDVQKNLQQPLLEISEAALAKGLLLPEIRVMVRTGDTPAWDRQQMIKRPPHILITTPESLYLLLTAERSRKILRDVRTVIVDEIHAVAPNKRGSHLALSLERLEEEAGGRVTRIGLSATQRPIETVARFLVGQRSPQGALPLDSHGGALGCRVIDVGHRRNMDLAVEVPKDELGPIATNAIWADIYDRLAELVRAHRSTLVFVNTRRLAERVAHYLTERLQDLGEQAVAAHHGSLSRKIRLSAEERLKRGQTRVVVATASLELGIDVGTIDLVCQIGSPRAIATCLQRVGRAGHWVGALPKGRLFASTRDELIECAALVRAIHAGNLDCIEVPTAPLDILAQQIVAAVATQEWREEELYHLCRRAYPYRELTRRDFDAVVRMLADGIATRRGRGQAYLHHDRVNKRLRARRGARLAAITSGGAIADSASYAVVAEPEGTVVGSVDEDFAVESLAGDIILLGNTSWRIRGVGNGVMRVEDAHGAPPTIPFWRGEAPARTWDLSAEVAAVREHIDRLAPSAAEGTALVVSWLQKECGLDRRGAEQVLAYVVAGRTILGTVPTQRTVIAERFFDEGGGMQLVLHAPFGGRINRAWGLALRKRFCTTFDFELQAAATDEGLVLSLGERHSFPLETVFAFLRSDSVREVLTQAILAAPMLTTRWRWNATRSLAMLRFANGRRVPPQIQRMRAEDLLAAVFPAAVACQDNVRGDPARREIPDHPLVQETIRDCLTEVMDVEGLEGVLRQIENGQVTCVSVETPTPSPFCHEILNANPYAFLDDAPLEERRARAVEMRRSLPPELADKVGALDPAAITEVVEEAWPVVRDPDELHDALLTLLWLPEDHAGPWTHFLPTLMQTGRVTLVSVPLTGTLSPQGRGEGEEGETHPSGQDSERDQIRGYVATEQYPIVKAALGDTSATPEVQSSFHETVPEAETAMFAIVRGWMESIGPTTAKELGWMLHVPGQAVETALVQLESDGQVLRGKFRPFSMTPAPGPSLSPQSSTLSPAGVEWCHRRLLARIHRLTIGRLRKEIQPVTAAEFMRFLFRWQHLSSGARLHGETGLSEIIHQLAGFEAAASAWERSILPLRLSKYDPDLLDRLCLRGAVAWGRLSLHPRLEEQPSSEGDPNRPRRILPTSLAPISFFQREDTEWLLSLHQPDGMRQDGTSATAVAAVSSPAQDLLQYLHQRGASFFADLVRGTGHLQSAVEEGLWELVAAGLVTSDGFDNLRALIDPRRRRAQGRERSRRPRHGAGRWSLLRPLSTGFSPHPSFCTQGRGDAHTAAESDRNSHVKTVAHQLLRRYGVVFRDLLGRESLDLAWRDLLVHYRRLELSGEVRGGRFVSGFTGEQFALPEAVEALRAMRKAQPAGSSQEMKISACDPLNLVGVILPGPRIPALPTNFIVFRDGLPVRSGSTRDDPCPVSTTSVPRTSHI